MDRSQVKWIWISVAFSTVVLLIILASTFDKNTLLHILQLNVGFLLIAVLLRVASLVFWAFRIQTMSGSLGYTVKFSHAFNLVLANLLAGAITPGQTGGEPVRVHELYRADVKIGDATAIVLMERVLDAVVLVVMGVIAMLLLESVWRGLNIGLVIAMVIGWALMIGLVVLLVYSTRKPEKVKVYMMRFLRWLGGRWKGKTIQKIVAHADTEMDNFFQSLSMFTSTGRKGLVFGTFFTVLFWASEFFVASLLLLSLGQPPFVAESYLFQLIIAVVMMVPLTPGSSGIAEISATSLYALIVPSSLIGLFVLLWRLLLYYFNIIVGIAASLNIFRRELRINAEKKER
jgi:glycosyltransferase 2 family protein